MSAEGRFDGDTSLVWLDQSCRYESPWSANIPVHMGGWTDKDNPVSRRAFEVAEAWDAMVEEGLRNPQTGERPSEHDNIQEL